MYAFLQVMVRLTSAPDCMVLRDPEGSREFHSIPKRECTPELGADGIVLPLEAVAVASVHRLSHRTVRLKTYETRNRIIASPKTTWNEG